MLVLLCAAIIRAVWGYSDYGSVKKLQVNMKNIRKKMGVTPGEKRYIINELGAGYRVLAEDEAYRCQSFAPLDSRGTMQMSFFRFYTKRRRLIFCLEDQK
jgi:DNA-binding winged helix-turn-helix (wHTH) protein